MNAALSGFGLGFSLILAIGSQNAFVLRQGLKNQHVLAVVLVCALSDALLIAAGVSGFGVLVQKAPWIEPMAKIGGALFLTVYGLRALWSAYRSNDAMLAANDRDQTLWQAMAVCLAFTWLNPHVYLDTVILLGSVSTQFAGQKLAFALGAMSASLVFFFALGFGAKALSPLFASPRSWRMLDAIVGITMLSIAVSLLN
ncbi:MAG: amino acid transporter [Gammaproteobacteria bacterium]|nr:amino acid transporter [Gammaproteobacteria bacterium]